MIDAAVDVNDIARFCLGRFWRIATPEQQRQYLGLFGDLLVTRIVGHLGEYQSVRVSMGLVRATEDTEIVITIVERPNNPAYQVDWVVSTSTCSPEIVDLLAGGTSLRLTQSSDFAAYLARHQYNIHELIEGMRQLIAQSGAYDFLTGDLTRSWCRFLAERVKTHDRNDSGGVISPSGSNLVVDPDSISIAPR